MTTIELVFDGDCPNVPAARDALRGVLAELNLPVEWQEWDRAEPNAPDHVKQYGSPTILVNGRDVSERAASDPAANDAASKSCRVYVDANGRFHGVPPAEAIHAALTTSDT